MRWKRLFYAFRCHEYASAFWTKDSICNFYLKLIHSREPNASSPLGFTLKSLTQRCIWNARRLCFIFSDVRLEPHRSSLMPSLRCCYVDVHCFDVQINVAPLFRKAWHFSAGCFSKINDFSCGLPWHETERLEFRFLFCHILSLPSTPNHSTHPL